MIPLRKLVPHAPQRIQHLGCIPHNPEGILALQIYERYGRWEKTVLPHHLRERENDLIGNYFEIYRKVPKYQFGNNQ